MKKLSLLLVIITLLTFFTSCTTKKYDSFQELSNGSSLKRGSIIYNFYSAMPKNSLRDEQSDNRDVFLMSH